MLMGCHQRDQPELGEVFRRQGSNHVFGPGVPPRATPIHAGLPGALSIKPQREHPGFPRAGLLPLPPDQAPQPSPHPCVQRFNWRSTLREAEVVRAESD